MRAVAGLGSPIALSSGGPRSCPIAARSKRRLPRPRCRDATASRTDSSNPPPSSEESANFRFLASIIGLSCMFAEQNGTGISQPYPALRILLRHMMRVTPRARSGADVDLALMTSNDYGVAVLSGESWALRPRSGEVTEHRDGLLEQSAILLVERGMDYEANCRRAFERARDVPPEGHPPGFASRTFPQAFHTPHRLQGTQRGAVLRLRTRGAAL